MGIHLGDVNHLAGVFLLHVGRDGEVAVVCQDVGIGDEAREVLFLLPLGKHTEDVVLIVGGEAVLVAVLHKLTRGIDEEHPIVGTQPLPQHDDAGGDTHSEEEVLGQLDEGVDAVVLDEPLANRLLLATPIEHTRELDDGCRAALAE